MIQMFRTMGIFPLVLYYVFIPIGLFPPITLLTEQKPLLLIKRTSGSFSDSLHWRPDGE